MVSDSLFIHAVATRLGIGVYDEAWFAHRLSLFEAITVPSMKAQTSRDFTWLLVVDERMPPVARARVDAITADVDNAVVLAVEFKSNLKDAVAAWARARAEEKGARFVLTSRLDDDDALNVGCVERLHEEAASICGTGFGGRAVVSFNVGTMWIPAERRGYTRYHDSHSLGLSVVENVDDCRGIYAWPHKDLKIRLVPRGSFVRGVDGDTRWWLYAVHVLADSDTGDAKRLAAVRSHKYGYRVDDGLLASFGLDPAVIDGLARLPSPKVLTPVKRLATRARDIEAEITRLRAELVDAAPARAAEIASRVDELEAARVAAGSGLVRQRAGLLSRLGIGRARSLPRRVTRTVRRNR